MTPYFFFSYARRDAGPQLDRFYTDLCNEIAGLTGINPDETGFRDTADISVGMRWLQSIEQALTTCRCFVPNYSPSLFLSQFAGREWSVFSQRVSDASGTGDTIKLVFPVVWRPVADLPLAVAELQYGTAAFGERYRDLGLLELMRMRKFEDDYQAFLSQFAKALVKGVTANNLPPSTERIDLDTVENAFDKLYKPDLAATSKRSSNELLDSLESLYEKRAEVRLEGRQTHDVDIEIAAVKRMLRRERHLSEGDNIGPGLRLVARLRSGGFGEVWKAYDSSRREFVGVKLLHAQFSRDQSMIDRFYRGARVMSGLRHPSVVRILDPRGQHEGRYFFVMELLRGGDLREAVLDGTLTRPDCLSILAEVGNALQFAHDRGVIHRDIKPQNIMLDDEGRPRITDFDLARVADSTGGTRTGAFGTAMFAAPEIWETAKDATPGADIYSLGMTVLFCLYGRDLPIAAFRRPDAFAEQVASGELLRVVRGALAESPSRRYMRIANFAEALRATIDHSRSSANAKREAVRSRSSGSSGRWNRALKDIADSGRYGRLRIGRQHGLVPLGADPLSGLWEFLCEDTGRPPQKRKGQHVLDTEAGLVLVLIPRGTGAIGAQRYKQPNLDHRAQPEEGPVHHVRIQPFFLSKFQMTRAQWQNITGNDPSFLHPELPVSDVGVLPVESVSWQTCTEVLGNVDLRLPAECEWEYACRASSSSAFYFGDDEQELDSFAWFSGNSEGAVHPVGQLSPNAFGLHDMHGNVWEWCRDTWHPTFSGAPTDGSSWISDDSNWKVNRGGGWRSEASRCRSASRDGDPSVSPDWDLGLRPARDVDL
ncbi:TIR-like protein FxsC [Paractinoplanes hotanensis]|uniref:non-specific serine/threonine protein kinase n=1 Tax=Paractinoplanes hotanensis TaxID=2906497 RepID=A0ABT0XY65_9ACTN|nr:TIR-like protein FxsC [Actinoplanes hotanensis]MCM4078716.1 TIR-like protein FxsC [Actinoplanes hotanensis]